MCCDWEYDVSKKNMFVPMCCAVRCFKKEYVRVEVLCDVSNIYVRVEVQGFDGAIKKIGCSLFSFLSL